MTFYEISVLLCDVLILIGVWLELWLAWRVLNLKRREAIKREVSKVLNKLGITVSLMLLASLSYGNAFAQWGVASSHPSKKDRSLVKFVEFGRAGQEGKLAYTLGVGGWTDATGYVGGTGTNAPSANSPRFKMKGGELKTVARNSAFVEALFGVEPTSDHFYISYKLGPAIITNPDSLLGSYLQCGHEFGIGMRDLRDVRVGLVVKHFSNAGLIKPNLGRDFIGLRIEF